MKKYRYFIPYVALLALCSLGTFAQPRLHMEGASNTAGLGSSLAFPDRINIHLQKEIIFNKSKEKDIFIAFDYFFPTNFGVLNTADGDHISEAKAVINQWQKQYSQILLMKLPSFDSDMTQTVREFIEEGDLSDPLTNILNVLSAENMIHKVRDLNQLFDEVANKSPQVTVMDFAPIFKYVDQSLRYQKWIHRNPYRSAIINEAAGGKVFSVDEMFVDPLHLGDKGQAIFFNELFKPHLEKIYGKSLSPMKVRDIPREQVASYINKKLCPDNTFMKKDNCKYWIKLTNNEQYNAENVKLHIPAHLTENQKAIKIKASNSSDVWDFVDTIEHSHPQSRKDILEVMALTDLIEDNGKSIKDGLMIDVVNNKEKVYIDLSKVLFFTNFPVFKSEDSTYESWGYDHWLSYKYFYIGGPFSNIYSDDNYIGRLGKAAPGTNYFLKAKFNKEKKTMNLTWKIYPTIEEQEDLPLRLEYIPAPFGSILKENPEDYPYIEYNLTLKIGAYN